MPKTVPIPQTADELNEMLNDPRAMADIFREGMNGNAAPFREWLTNYEGAFAKNDPGVNVQTQEQIEAFMIDYLKEHQVENLRALNLDSHLRPRQGKNTVYNKAALGAKHDGTFEDIGDVLYTLSEHSFKNDAMTRKLESLRNDASSLKPSDGGFLIPETLRAQVLQLSIEQAIVRSRATVMPMDSLRVPIPAVDSTSNVSSIFGGITGFWTEEGATLTESRPRFGRVVLEAHKLTLYVEVPNELIMDSRPSYTTFIDTMFPQAIAWFEDVAFFVGGGVGEPLGFLNAPGRVEVSRNPAGAAVEWVDITNMYSRMLPQSIGNAVWIVSPDVLPSLLTMIVAGSTSAVWLGGGGFPAAASAPPMTMLGRPLIVSEKARAAGSAGDVNFVDFTHYLLGDRQAMTARQSEEFRFNEDATAFRVIERIDGRPWVSDPIVPQNNSANTLSPYIKLV